MHTYLLNKCNTIAGAGDNNAARRQDERDKGVTFYKQNKQYRN